MRAIVLRAETPGSGLWDPAGSAINVAELPLSDRLTAALADWMAFYQEVDGVLDTPEIIDEFVSQGYKIAHGVRRELKGSTVWFDRPDSGERVSIELRRPR